MPGEHQDGCGHTVGANALTNIDPTEVRKIPVENDEVYGWRDDQLIGESLGLILPPSFRDSHHAGFARFKLTEVSKVLNHPLKLATYCSDGRAIDSEHFIVAEKKEDGSWSFAATLRPVVSIN